MPKVQKEIQYTVGIEDLLICMQTSPGTTTIPPTYEEDVYSQTNITDVTITPNIAAFTKWASNKKIINIVKNGSYGLAFNLAGLAREVKDKMFGKVSKRGVSFEDSNPKEYPKFAIGLVLPLSDGNKVLRWYPNCSISPSEESYATINEEMTINDTAYTISADPLLFNDNTLAELDTGRTNADITEEQFMSQVIYDESQLEQLFPSNGITISVSPESANLAVGETEQLTANVIGATDTSVSWESSNKAVATVDTTGLVTAVSAGSATITATSIEDTTKKDTATITVV